MYLIVTYDISNDKKRNRLAKDLLQFGIRTQKSFFECEVNKKELTIIKQIINRVAEGDDLVTIYHTNEENIERIGDVKYIEVDDMVF